MPAKFTCQFTMDNAAFDEDYGTAAQGVLEAVAEKVGSYRTGGKIRDVNGNTIGSWKIR
jgi:hypothetical protein